MCKSVNGKPDIQTLESKATPAILTLNNDEIKKALVVIAINAYPGYKIPEFDLILHQKDRAKFHGIWYYPKPNQISKIEIFNLYRKYEHTLSTTIHELAHHCHYMLDERTNHKKEFYDVLKHLLEVAHNLGFINLVQTYDMIDSADRKRLVKYYGPPRIFDNLKADIELIKIDGEPINLDFTKRGYIYSHKEKKWICSLLNKSTEEELAWIANITPGAKIEIINNKTNQVKSVFYCVIGHAHLVHSDTLKTHGFSLDPIHGWMIKATKNDSKVNNFLHQNNVQATYYSRLPNCNRKVKSLEKMPTFGEKADEYCPLCGSQLQIKTSNFGKYIYCSKFLLGCRYQKVMQTSN